MLGGIKELIESGDNTAKGTPAHFALTMNFLKLDFFEKLIITGLDINSIDSGGRTILWIAISKFNTSPIFFQELCILLLKAGAFPNKADRLGISPVMKAVLKTDYDALRFILEWNSDCSTLERFDLYSKFPDTGLNIFCKACQIPDIRMIVILLTPSIALSSTLSSSLHTPSSFTPPSYLSSKKLSLKWQTSQLILHFQRTEESALPAKMRGSSPIFLLPTLPPQPSIMPPLHKRQLSLKTPEKRKNTLQIAVGRFLRAGGRWEGFWGYNGLEKGAEARKASSEAFRTALGEWKGKKDCKEDEIRRMLEIKILAQRFRTVRQGLEGYSGNEVALELAICFGKGGLRLIKLLF